MSSNTKKSNTYTFWELVANHSIEIPIIQRDYVQGREKEKRIRSNFLGAIYEALKNKKTLHLDFIYGVIKDTKFIPLDGQQRLTTLFLLHYYLSLNKSIEFQKHLIDENNNIKFTYEVRSSSREFCQQLISQTIQLKENSCISKIIEDENWFFSKWKQDPTISSMLIMLDNIQEIFKKENLFELLKEQITFSFLDPTELQIKNANELYIKMNSRGKPLNEFENFKSYFVSFLQDEKKIAFDNEWFEIFWGMKKESIEDNANIKETENIIENKIFGAYFNFFKNITVFYSEEFKEMDIFKFDYKDRIDEISKTLDCLTTNNIKINNAIDKRINKLRDSENFKMNIFQDFLKDSEKITYEERLRFYALMKFFIKIGKIENNEILFMQWMKICRSLINNASPYAIKNDYIKLLELLNNLADLLLKSKFYLALSEYSIKDNQVPKHIKLQLKEEILKATLICQKLQYEAEFIKAEENWYLDGQIGFLIEYAGGGNDFDIKKFIEYREKFEALWQVGKDNKILIYQALLTKGDYLPKVDSNYTFCSFDTSIRMKSENWRKVFNKDKLKTREDNSITTSYFKSLLDNINKSEPVISLQNIIKKWLEHVSCENNKDYYIYNLIKSLKHNNKILIRFNNVNNTYLLNSSMCRSNTYQKELYTFNLFYENFKDTEFKPFRKIWYYGQGYEACIVLDSWKINNHNLAIDIKYKKINDADGYKFSIEFFDRNEKIKDIDDAISKLLKDNFTFYDQELRYINTNYGLCQQDELITFLEKLMKEFEQLK